MQAAQATDSQNQNEQPLSRTIIETVAEAEGVAPTELDARLYDVLEPEALDDLFQHQADGPATDGFVSFTFHGYTVHRSQRLHCRNRSNQLLIEPFAIREWVQRRASVVPV